MSTQQTGRVRLSITATDRRLASAVVSRFLEWWDASGHLDLVTPADVEPRPDVSWNSNTASITLPVQFTAASEPAPGSVRTDRAAEIAPNGSFVEFHALAHRAPVGGGGRDWVFEVVDDLPDTDLMFPSETASRRALDKIRRWRRRKNPITRVTSRAAATTVSGARGMSRLLSFPWHAAARAAHASRDAATSMARHVTGGLRFIAGPRPLVRAAAVSVVLALAITASIGLPNRILSAARDSRAGEPARVIPPASATIEKPAVRVAVPIATAPVPSRSLVMLRGPARISPSRRVATYIRTARASIRRSQLASIAAQRKSELALTAAERKKEQALLAAQRQTQARSRTAPKQLAVNTTAAKPTLAKPTLAPKTPPSDPKPTATTGSEYTGSLVVMSEPSGAAVKIDGQVMGTTPLQIDRIRAGSHAIHVSLDGYPVWSRSATVVYGKSNGVVAQLTK